MSDFERIEKDGAYIVGTSLVERVLTTCCKKIEEKKLFDLIEYFLGYLNRYIDIFEDNIWLKYHKGKLLLMSGKFNDAREYIIPVVREKQTESWAWNILGLSYLQDDIEKSISCFVRGISECKEENFIINIRLELAKILINKEMYEEAKFEIQKIVDFKRKSGQNISTEVYNLYQQDWFSKTTLPNDNSHLYNNYINNSNKIILDSLPWVNAIINNIDSKTNKVYILLNDQEDVSVKQELIKSSYSVTPGTPVSVKIGKETGKTHIYDLEPRDAEKWDLLKKHIGVIDNVNKEKSLSHIIISNKIDCIMHYDKFPDQRNLQIGAFVECKLKHFNRNGVIKYTLLTCNITNENPDSSIYREITGEFIDPDDNIEDIGYDDYNSDKTEQIVESANRKCSTYGFVESETLSNNVYIDKTLVIENSLHNGDKVSCKIVYSKKKNGKDGWKAISLNKLKES